MASNKWTYEETLIAFDLYCRMPFGKIHHRNPEIIRLASILERTPSAVAMKMVNLASLDPEMKKRGIRGLSNHSKVECEVWKDFNEKGAELIRKSAILLAEKDQQPMDIGTPLSLDYSSWQRAGLDTEEAISPGGTRAVITQQRVGQGFFRDAVLASYNYKCCITGISIPQLLIASHIKPWSKSDDKTEKTDPRNGLCLNALHDRAFDMGLITIDFDYKIIISPKFESLETDSVSRELLFEIEGRRIALPEKFLPNPSYLEYHHENVFLA